MVERTGKAKARTPAPAEAPTPATETAPPAPTVHGVAIVEHAGAPELFADFAPLFSVSGGIVRLVLTSFRPGTGPIPAQHVVIGRLLMPIAGAQALAANLYDFLVKQGFDPVPRPPAGDVQ